MTVHQEIYEKLKKVAKAKQITYYSDIAPLAGLDMASGIDRIRIAQILDQINLYEGERDFNSPMLSAVVILVEKNSPGTGFYECARGLGKYNGSANEKDRLTFWARELEKVHKYWQSHS